MQDIVLDRFKTRLEDLGLSINKIDEEGLIYIEHGENTLKISLDNVRRSYDQNGNFDHLDNLVQSIHDYIMEIPIPEWNECKSKVFLSLFPSNFDFGDYINEKVTSDFHKYYVYFDNNQYVWINHEQLDVWNISEQEFKMQVDNNMNNLLDKTNIEMLQTENNAKLAYFDAEIEGLKAALLFSKNLKQKVLSILGFPIYCVLPVRDFCYMFSEQDKDDLINSLGETVLKEYQNSGYEITTEIIKISDEGIEAIGKYKL